MYKILIVDDEKIIREGMQRVMPWNELEIDQVFTAASGKEAIAIIEREMPQIMITDIYMSEMTGLQLIEKAREIIPEMRVLVLTGYDDFEYARESLRLHVQDFLLKPIDEDTLCECIRAQVNALKEEDRQRQTETIQIGAENFAARIEVEKALRDLLHDRNTDEAMRVLTEDYPFPENTKFLTAVLAPDSSDTKSRLEGNETGDSEIHLRQMEELCLEWIDAKGKGITVRDDGVDRVTTLVLSADQRDDSCEEIVSGLLDVLMDEFGTVPRASIGTEVSELSSLSKSYQDALLLLEENQKDETVLLQSKNVIQNRQKFREVYDELKLQMCSNFSDVSFMMQAYDTFSQATKSYSLTAPAIRNYCFELLADISFNYNASGGSSRDLKLENLLRSLPETDRETCLEVGRQYLSNLLGGEEKDIHEIVSQSKLYINAHLSEALSVGSIAEKFYVSPNYFSRLFKRVTGTGCNEYIVQQRIEKACLLLETTSLNAGKIASMVGYSDTNYFSMTFKKHCGVSPTQYRSQFQEEKDLSDEKGEQQT